MGLTRPQLLLALVAATGGVLLSVGAGLVFLPAGLIVAGLLLLAAGLFSDFDGKAGDGR